MHGSQPMSPPKTSFPKDVVRHFSARTITCQITYPESGVALLTAKNLVRAKVRNQRHILTNFRQSRQRCGSPDAPAIASAQQRLTALRYQCLQAVDMRELFLLEAQAARIYWSILQLVAMQSPEWRRRRPKASDPLNILLNTGYANLIRTCRQALIDAGLLPQIGIMHGTNVPEPLVYDFMEPFRQPMVDAVILPLFSRKKNVVERLTHKDMGKGFSLLHDRYAGRTCYAGRCEAFTTIIVREAVALRRACMTKGEYKPFQYPWRHAKACS
jgi:CRISPR-associated endonuclease Cas1